MSAWREDEDTTIRRHAKTHSASQIAGLLPGRSRASVIGRAWRLGESLSKDAVTRRELEHPAVRRPGSRSATDKPAPADVWPLASIEARRAALRIAPRLARLTDLEVNECRWPYGEDEMRFCGLAVRGDGPYCGAHRRLAYVADALAYDAEAIAREVERKENKTRTIVSGVR